VKHIITLPIAPCPAPRQSRSDAWKPRPCVIRYRQFRDEVAALWPKGLAFPEYPAILFTVAIAKSISKKKRALLDGTAHLSVPDADNLLKAFLDALYRDEDDSHVWNALPVKVWGLQGSIAVFSHTPDIASMIAQTKAPQPVWGANQ